MSERELRDEVEALFDQVKRERARLEVPIHDEVDTTTAELCAEIGLLEDRLPLLREKNARLSQSLEAQELELTPATEQLAEARAQIASREKPVIGPDLSYSWGFPRSESAEEPVGCSLAFGSRSSWD